jgi:NAD(P) transhydrogenase
MQRYDLVVLGAGPAGEKGAAQAAWFGRRVAIVEKERVVGGACVNTGTVPSKTLREAALQLSGFRQREVYGIDLALQDNVRMSDLTHRKQQVIDREHEMIEANIERHRIDRYHGAGRLRTPHEVVVEGDAETVLETEFVLIATGSRPFRPDHIPFDDLRICDSDSILSIPSIPRSLTIVGAGVIGCEYASIFAALGVPVSLVDGRTALLPHIDREIATVLLASFEEKLGVKLHFGHEVEALELHDDDIVMRLANGVEVLSEKVLYAAGRSSNTDGLGLEEAGVALGKRGLVLVDEAYRTSVPNIYAAGDVIGFPALASTSMEQARVAMVHAFDLKYKTRVSPILPFAIYTIPELSSVGKTEQECEEEGVAYETGRALFCNNARGQIVGDSTGMLKLVFDPGSLKILGVHVIGENASELVHTGSMAMQFDATINAFIDSVFNFPSLGETYKYAAYDGLGRVAARRGR